MGLKYLFDTPNGTRWYFSNPFRGETWYSFRERDTQKNPRMKCFCLIRGLAFVTGYLNAQSLCSGMAYIHLQPALF